MVLRIIRSKICRPSNFHKPNFCTSHMQKSTRSDLPEDEIARRKEYQKIIDYTFGPPKLQRDDISSDLSQEDNASAMNLMENLKDKPLHSTHGVLGQTHKSTEECEELLSEPNLQEAHRINSQNWPRQAPQIDFGECRARSSNLHSIHHIDCPHYYRRIEAQMYDNFAQKYLKMETGEMDKLLAKEMENLELPKSKMKCMRAIYIYNNVKTVDTHGYHTDAPVASQTIAPDQRCTLCSLYCPSPTHSNIDDMPTINSFGDNVEEGFTLQSNSNGYHDDILPLNVIHCSDLPLHCVPKSISNPRNEKLELDERLPCDLLQPATIVDNSDIEWGDKSRKIIQPIERSETSVQIQSYSESAATEFYLLESKLQDVQVNEPTDHHMIQEAKQAYHVNFAMVTPQVEPQNYQQELNSLTKMNLIETNISEHINTHQESNVQAHLEIEQPTEPLKPWTEERLKKMMRDNLVNPSPVENTELEPRERDAVEQNLMHSIPQGLEQQARFNPSSVENTESEPRETDAVEQNLKHAVPQGLEQQARFNPFAVENTEQSTQQQTWANPFGEENKEPSPQSTDSMLRHCVHAPSMTHSESNAKIAEPVNDILNNLHLDGNLSLSELLRRVRALNRLQYCKECGMLAVATKCPPTDRPQCPPPPDCVRDCPPPEKPKPKCPPCPECPPPPTCPPPPPECPPPKPKCPPEPQCPPPTKCPPPEKPKCPSPCPPPPDCPGKCGCQSTEPNHPVTVPSYTSTLLKGKLSKYFMELINKCASKLKYESSLDSLVFRASHPNNTETLHLNRVKDFEPWVPLPSWPYPVDYKKKKLQCPDQGCPGPKQLPVRPNCPPLPCSGFPKRLKISAAD